MICVTVQYFAGLRERLNREHEILALPSPADANTLIAALVSAHPAAAEALRCCRIAVDHSFVTGPVTLTARSEVAVIPPVSGG